MNILPKKKWHVRTRDNILRVRRDEAKAAAELKEVEQRVKLANQEARTSFLRAQAKSRIEKEGIVIPEELKQKAILEEPLKHVNLFEDLEAGETTAATNKDNEAEKKKEIEEYEKKVGILTYLGQDSQELTGERSWWEKLPLDRAKPDGEEGTNDVSATKTAGLKDFHDPLNSVRKYLGCEGVKRLTSTSKIVPNVVKEKEKAKKRKRKHHSSSDDTDDDKDRKSKKRRKKEKKKRKKKKKRRQRSDSSSSGDEEKDKEEEEREAIEKKAMLNKLRIERLERERKEREKTEILLYGKSLSKKSVEEKQEERLKETRKYNNQFNPEMARQNKLDSKKKYWLE